MAVVIEEFDMNDMAFTVLGRIENGEVVRYVEEIQLKDDQKAQKQLLKATGAYDVETPDTNVENLTINQWNEDLNDHLKGEGDRWPQVKEIDD